MVGVEAGTDEMLKRIKKGIGVEKMREFAANASEAGIRVHGCFMIGGPGETRETAMQLLSSADELAAQSETMRTSVEGFFATIRSA